MISYIIGTVEQMTENSIVVECNGIGYFMLVSSSTLSKVTTKAQVKMHTVLNVREDGMYLYGFAAKEELDMFNLLTSVTGIGPKVALNMLSAMPASQIMLAVLTDDHTALAKAPGVGKKTAQRVTLELKDKIRTRDAVADMAVNPQQAMSVGGGGAKQDAIDALIALGYGRSETVRAVLEIAVENMDAEQMIKLALKKLAAF